MSLPKTFTAGERLFASDLNDNFEYLEDEVGDLDTAIGNIIIPAGIGSNVVQTVKTDTFTTTSNSFTAVTGLTATITPTTTSSLILVIIDVKLSVQAASGAALNTLMLRLTGGNSGTYIGDADGSRERVAAAVSTKSGLENDQNIVPTTLVYLDNPASTSPVTYGIEIRQGVSRVAAVNRTNDDSNASNRPRSASTITLIEVAA